MSLKGMTRIGATAAVLAVMCVNAPAAEAKTITGNTSAREHNSIAEISYDKTAKCGTVDLLVTKSTGNQFDKPSSAGQISGITFVAQQLKGYDLTTNKGWADARALSETQAAKRPVEGEPYRAVTDESGVARFEGLPIGLYYVEELKPVNPQGAYKQSNPMLITLPVGAKTKNDLGEWIYGWDCEVEVQTKPKPNDIPPWEPPTVPPTTSEVPPTTPVNTPPATPENTPPLTSKIRGSLAQTGVTAPGVLVGLGLLLVAALTYVAFRRKQRSEEQ